MFISGLNRFFARHGRIIFGVFTGAIIISFVLYFAPGFDLFSIIKSGNDTSIATMMGRKVSENEYRQSIDSIAISLALSAPGVSPGNNFLRQQAESMALQRILLSRAAAERNINVSNIEIAEFLRSVQMFQKNGSFDKTVFENYVEEYLKPCKMNKLDLDNAVREQLIVERLVSDISSGVIITPDEMRQAFNSRFEKFKVQLLKFKMEDYLSQINPEEKELESFFNANSDKYKIAPKFKIKLVRFNHVDYEKKAEPGVSEARIKEYYEANKESFKEKDAVQAIEKVSEKIKGILTERDASTLALKEGQGFADDAYQATSLAKSNDAIIAAFAACAEKKNFKSYDSDWFSADDENIKKVGKEPEIISAVSQLPDGQPVSDVIPGNKAAFVVCLLEKVKERKATYDEAKAKVTEDFKHEKAISLAREKAKDAALKLTESLLAGKKIEDQTDYKFEDIKEFDFMNPVQSPDGYAITSLATDTSEGRISAVHNTDTGAMFIFCQKRSYPSDAEFKEKESFFKDIYAQMKKSIEVKNFIASISSAMTVRKNDEETGTK